MTGSGWLAEAVGMRPTPKVRASSAKTRGNQASNILYCCNVDRETAITEKLFLRPAESWGICIYSDTAWAGVTCSERHGLEC